MRNKKLIAVILSFFLLSQMVLPALAAEADEPKTDSIVMDQEFGENASDVQGEDPSDGDKEPGDGDEEPGDGEEEPGDGEEEPGDGEEGPSDGDEEPGDGDEKPGDGDKEPGDGDEKPGDGEEEPGDGEEEPGDGEEEPGDGDEKPGDGDEEPGDGDEKPGDGEEEPGDGEEEPGDGEEEPGDGEEEPGDEDNFPEWYDPEEDTYYICSAQELAELAILSETVNFSGKTICLTDDIEDYIAEFPIGPEELPFAGTFDGQNHTVTFSSEESSPWGLFGYLDVAKISNLHIKDAVVSADGGCAGVLAASMSGGSVTYVWLDSVTVTGNADYMGGMAGESDSTLFRACLVSDFQTDSGQYAGSYLGCGSGMLFLINCAVRNSEVKDILYQSMGFFVSVGCFCDEVGMDESWTVLSDAAFASGEAAYLLTNSSNLCWGVKDGVTAPLDLLGSDAKTASLLTVTLSGDLASGTLTADGKALALDKTTGAYSIYGLAGDVHTLAVQGPEFACEYKILADTPTAGTLEQVNDHVWMYTFSEENASLCLELVEAADIEWYLGHESDSEYWLSTAEQLTGLRQLVNGTASGVEGAVCFQGKTLYLTQDVALSEIWTSIGTEETPFSGTFSGAFAGAAVSEEDGEQSQAGPVQIQSLSGEPLFHTLSKAVVSNLQFDGTYTTAALAVTAENSWIETCTNYSSVSGTKTAGGLVANASGTTFQDCRNEGTVTGTSYAGGIAGSLENGTLTDCQNEGTVTATSRAGGIAGSLEDGTLTDCRNEGTVTATSYAGGIAGYQEDGTLTDCRNEGTVTATSYAGGITSSLKNGTLKDCANSGPVQGGMAGGISGYGNAVTCLRCVNTGDITVTVRPVSNTAAGIVSYLASGTMTDCRNEGTITGLDYAGGIACLENNGKVVAENCINKGSIYSGGMAAGIVFTYYANGTITNCVNQGSVEAGDSAGGIVSAMCSGVIDISRCRNEGSITAGNYSGGIVGYTYFFGSGSVIGCLNQGDITVNNPWSLLTGAGGIVGNMKSINGIRVDQCLNLGKITAVYPETAGGIVGSGQQVSGSNYSISDSADDSTALTEEQIASGEAAWMLNQGEGLWGQGEDGPIPCDADHPAIRKLTVNTTGAGHLTVSPDAVYIPAGTSLTFTPAPDEGQMVTLFKFDGQNVSVNAGASVVRTMPDHDCIVNVGFGAAFAEGQENFKVTIDFQDGSNQQVQSVQPGNTANEPKLPDRDGILFLGWFTQPEGGTEFDFDTLITHDTTVYAQWKDERFAQLHFHSSNSDGTEEIQTISAWRGQEADTEEIPEFTPASWENGNEVYAVYQLTAWLTEDGELWDYQVPADTEEMDLYAQWQLVPQMDIIPISSIQTLKELAQYTADGETLEGFRFALERNIVLDESWDVSIGSYSSDIPFCGEFYGGTITLDHPAVPLFGYLGEDAYVHDITVTGTATEMSVEGKRYNNKESYYAAGLALWNAGQIENIRLDTLTLGNGDIQRVGGVACWNLATGKITNCTVSGTNLHGQSIGGITAVNNGTVHGCNVDDSHLESVGVNTFYSSNYTSYWVTLGTGGIVGTNVCGTVEDCNNAASITVTGHDTTPYAVAGGVVGISRLSYRISSDESTLVQENHSGAIRGCTNRGEICVTAQYPIVGGVIGVFLNGFGTGCSAVYVGDLINQGDIQVTNQGTIDIYNALCDVGGVIGKITQYSDVQVATIENLQHHGVIQTDRVSHVGGVLGATYNVNNRLLDCTASGSIKAQDTAYIGGVYGSPEHSTYYFNSDYYDTAGQNIILERCAAEVDIQAAGSTTLVGGVAAWHEQTYNKGSLGEFSALPIRNCYHLGALTVEDEDALVNGICPKLCTIERSWHGDGETVEVFFSSEVTDRYNDVTEYTVQSLPAQALASGEAAWLLDRDENGPLAIWTQGDGHPIWGTSSVYRVTVEPAEYGSVSTNVDYAAAGSLVTVLPSGESVEDEEGKIYSGVLTAAALTWQDEDGTQHSLDITEELAFEMPEADVQITASFVLEEVLEEEEPDVPEEPLPVAPAEVPTEQPSEVPEETPPEVQEEEPIAPPKEDPPKSPEKPQEVPEEVQDVLEEIEIPMVGSDDGLTDGNGTDGSGLGSGQGSSNDGGDGGFGQNGMSDLSGTGSNSVSGSEPHASQEDAPQTANENSAQSSQTEDPIEDMEEMESASNTADQQADQEAPVEEDNILDQENPLTGMPHSGLGQEDGVRDVDASDGAKAAPSVWEILPGVLEHPHVLIIAGTLAALLLAGGALWYVKRRRE